MLNVLSVRLPVLSLLAQADEDEAKFSLRKDSGGNVHLRLDQVSDGEIDGSSGDVFIQYGDAGRKGLSSASQAAQCGAPVLRPRLLLQAPVAEYSKCCCFYRD